MTMTTHDDQTLLVSAAPGGVSYQQIMMAAPAAVARRGKNMTNVPLWSPAPGGVLQPRTD